MVNQEGIGLSGPAVIGVMDEEQQRWGDSPEERRRKN